MKYYFLIFSLLVSLCAKSQQEDYSQNSEQNEYNYPNTNIGKGSLALHVGFGNMLYTGNIDKFVKPTVCGAVSLDLYFINNFTFSLTAMGTTTNLQKDITIKNKLWTPNDTVDFQSYGFYFGRSLLNNVHWRINPFIGIVLSHTKFTSPDGTTCRIGPEPSPIAGINFSYRFINVKKAMQQRDKYSGESGCWGINARMTFVPFAVHNKSVPFSGGIWYMTIGVTLNMFGID